MVIIAVMHLFLIAYVTTCGHGYYCRDAFVLDCFWLLVKVANDESHTHIFSSRLPTMQHSCNTPSTLSISEGGTNLGQSAETKSRACPVMIGNTCYSE